MRQDYMKTKKCDFIKTDDEAYIRSMEKLGEKRLRELGIYEIVQKKKKID